MGWERFANAPIAEALLDIRVSFSAPVEAAKFESFHDAIAARYPTKEGRVRWTGEIQLAPELVQQAIRRRPEGFLFKSSDGKLIVQARQDGYTFNWLKPYDRWEMFRDEASEHWQRYRDLFGPEAVTRLGLRYINKLELPLPLKDFREYVLTAPDIAPGIPQELSTFFMRLEIPDAEHGLMAIVSETMQPPDEGGTRLPFILDIDIVRDGGLDPSSPTIWETFEQMRTFKNEIFFASITPKSMELFR